MNTYDIYFHNDENSNNKGFKLSLQEARDYVEMGLKSGGDYFDSYKGGIVEIFCNETEEVVEYYDL